MSERLLVSAQLYRRSSIHEEMHASREFDKEKTLCRQCDGATQIYQVTETAIGGWDLIMELTLDACNSYEETIGEEADDNEHRRKLVLTLNQGVEGDTQSLGGKGIVNGTTPFRWETFHWSAQSSIWMWLHRCFAPGSNQASWSPITPVDQAEELLSILCYGSEATEVKHDFGVVDR